MKKLFILITASLITFSFSQENPSEKQKELFEELQQLEEKSEHSKKLQELVNRVTDQSDIKKLTKDDIPEEWKTTEIRTEDKDFHTKIFKRGKDTILKISLLKKTHTLKNFKYDSYYQIKITHKTNHVVTIMNIDGEIMIQPNGQNQGYSVNTHILKSQEINLAMMGPNEWFEGIELKGINTTLMDDLEYTKQSLLLGRVRKLIDHAIPKEKAQSTEPKKNP